jgi:small subunit ribosomal protein S16
MVRIRLARTGTKHEPKYRITVADHRRYVTSKFIEVLGYYNPLASGNDKKVELNMERYNHWVQVGAQPTDRVKHVAKLAQGTK